MTRRSTVPARYPEALWGGDGFQGMALRMQGLSDDAKWAWCTSLTGSYRQIQGRSLKDLVQTVRDELTSNGRRDREMGSTQYSKEAAC